MASLRKEIEDLIRTAKRNQLLAQRLLESAERGRPTDGKETRRG